MLALIFCEFRFHLLAVARALSNLLRFFAAAIFWLLEYHREPPHPQFKNPFFAEGCSLSCERKENREHKAAS